MADSQKSGPSSSHLNSDKTQEKSESKAKKPEKQKQKAKPVKEIEKSAKSSDEPVPDNTILNMLKSIQAAQKASDAKLTTFSKRMNSLEQCYEGEYDEADEFEYRQSPLQALETECEPRCTEDAQATQQAETQQTKRKEIEDSPFSRLSKRFKSVDVCDHDIDSVLASNITDLFRKGMDEEQYAEMIKDEHNARPGNCEGLSTVKCNQLVWDIMPQSARTTDRKLQSIETSVVKSATILVKMIDNVAKKEKDTLESVIDECNDALALLGHANKQINMARRDFMKPEMRNEYNHLCTHSLPYTDQLFGDDVSKTAKEIEDCAKMGHKMQTYTPSSGARSFRGRPVFRGRFRTRARGFRGRGTYMYSQAATSYPEAKNYQRRGAFRSQSRN